MIGSADDHYLDENGWLPNVFERIKLSIPKVSTRLTTHNTFLKVPGKSPSIDFFHDGFLKKMKVFQLPKNPTNKVQVPEPHQNQERGYRNRYSIATRFILRTHRYDRFISSEEEISQIANTEIVLRLPTFLDED